MDINKILTSDYLDILFDGRNKLYGSYELRKTHIKRMRKAMYFIFGILFVFTATSVLASMKPARVVEKSVGGVCTLTPPPEIPIDPPPPPPPPPPSPAPTVRFTPPVIEQDERVDVNEMPPDQNDLDSAMVGVANIDGDPGDIVPAIAEPGTGTGVVAPPAPIIHTYVEQMPQPPYNVNQYIADKLIYPRMASESGISGRVAVKFVVNEDGTISNVQMEGSKRLGAGIEEEAMRVVRSFPKWTPGKQNGRAVKVYFTLPIKFVLSD